MSEIEELKALFEDIREFVKSLREEEERSHAERERMLQEWLEEARRIRELLEEQNQILRKVEGVIDEAKEKVRNFPFSL